MQLYLVRHGESGNNALAGGDFDYDRYMATRNPDPLLTETGQQQAQRVGGFLAGSGYGITELHCSPMTRAMQTAQPIGRALGLPPRVWIDIHEHGGIFTGNQRNGDRRGVAGITRAEATAAFPGYVLPSEMTEDGWYLGEYEELAVCDVRARCVAETLQSRAAEDAVLALVSHGTFIDRLLKALFQQTDNGRDFFYFQNNTSITWLEFKANGPTILRFTNRVEHLTKELITA